MSSPNTRIAEIVDVTAAIAGTLASVRITFGAGSGLVDDPLRAGEKIASAPPNPTEPFTHVSDLPSVVNLALGQYGEDILTSVIPMRFFVQAEDLTEVRTQLVAMYPLYLAALANTITLRGTCQRWSNLTYRLGHEAPWAWLELGLTVVERLVLTKNA